MKWYRDTFASSESQSTEIYPKLFSELPDELSSVIVLPHFEITGPPKFIPDSKGIIAGLRLDTERGDILKGIIEGITFYLRENIESLPATGIEINCLNAVGGGSQSDEWLQISANILEIPISRPQITEAGALGAAIIAGVGSGMYSTFEEAVATTVKLERTFEPDPDKKNIYLDRFQKYKQIWPIMGDYLRSI